MDGKTYAGLLKEAEDYLAGKQVAENRLDAWYLFSRCFSMDRARYFLKAPCPIEEEEEKMVSSFWKMVKKRGRRIPLQQILKEQEFMGLRFFVDNHVLIPRQDTETLVEMVLKDIKGLPVKQGFRILDLCTGSGCIGISLAKYLPQENLQIVLSDISEDALKVAGENMRRLECGHVCCVVHSDLFEKFKEITGALEQFDIIVSNPPYIPSRDIEKLEPEVRDHEPLLALDGSEDGLSFYRRIAEEAAGYLKPSGCIYVEIGWNQGQEVGELFEKAGFVQTEIVKDLAGKDRVVKALIPGRSR